VLGFERLSKFAQAVSPWIFLIFIAGALASLFEGMARLLSAAAAPPAGPPTRPESSLTS